MPGQNQAPGEVFLGYNGDGQPMYGNVLPPEGSGATRLDEDGRPMGNVNLYNPSDLQNVRMAYTQLHDLSDDQVRQYLQNAGIGSFQLGDHLQSTNSAYPLSQILDNSKQWWDYVAPMVAGGLAAGGAAGLFGAEGAAGAGAAAGGGAAATGAEALPAWAGGVPESLTLGGGAAGTGLGGASLAGSGLTTAEGVGTGFAAGGSGVDAATAPFSFSGGGGGGGPTPQSLMQQLQQMGVSPQQAAQVVQQLMQQGGGAQSQGGAGMTQQGGQQNPLQQLLPLLGVGSGLNTMFNSTPAVDPNMVKALWQAGQQTYQTSLDPQNALYGQTAGHIQDQSRAADSVRGIGMGGVSAGNENDAMRKFNIDWQNQQLQRQLAGLGGFAQAGGVGAQAGVANNAQAFMQNQTGLNNLTTGLGQLFNGGQGQGAGNIFGGGAQQQGGNQIGQWLSQMGGGQQGGQQQQGGYYNPFPTLDQNSTNTAGQPLGGGVGDMGFGGATGGYSTPTQPYQNPWLDYNIAPSGTGWVM
jgi:hypothetical protein